MAESYSFVRLPRPVAFALASGGLCLSFHLLAAASVGAAPSAAPAAGTHLSGQAIVIDGDTLSISGTHVRLEGIDAPEVGQTCKRRWLGSWDCGQTATKALRELTAGRRVSCESRGSDKYGRMLGICSVDGRDINGEMVRRGLAWAFVKYSATYVEVEKVARAEKVGIWEAETEPAWIYRDNRWASAEPAAPEGCAIKGNITAAGHIYHMPWSPWYGKVRVEPAKGERWFCSESEATAAGWRPAMVN